MKRRPVQYLGLILLVLASLALIFLPIAPRPTSQPFTVSISAPKPFSALVAKDKTAPDLADAAFVSAFKNATLPGALTVSEDGKTATIADTATTRIEAQNRADKIVAALQKPFKGVKLAPATQEEIAKLPVEPLFPLGTYAVFPPRVRDGNVFPAIKLGLDLQGGVNLVLQVRRAQFPYDLAGAPGKTAEREAVLAKIRAALNQTDADLGLRNVDVAFADKSNRVEIRTQAKDKAQFDAQKTAIDAAMKTLSGASFTPGRAQFYQQQSETAQAFGDDYGGQLLNRTVEILRSRVDSLGVSEPLIQAQKPDRVLVQLPGVNDPQKAVAVIGQTAQMQIVLLPQDLQPGIDRSDPNNTIFTDSKGNVVSGNKVLELSQRETGATLLRLGATKSGEPQPIVSGQDVKPTTTAGFTQGGAPQISFQLQGEGVARFGAVTREVAGKNRFIPIFLDDKCISAPTVEGAITGGQGQISGGFANIKEAQDLALLLNSGALPAPIDVIENRTISAVLGNDSLKKSLAAGAIGLVLVAIFMIVFYRLAGFLANLALAVYCVLNLAAFILVGGTLTLPGIAGFLLALAMSLDTNILVFERLKEEMAIQPTFAGALRAAFNRAWTAILDSHVTTLIAATVLFYFGTGPVKGFALTLGIGVLLSLFSAISVTRLFMWSVAGAGERNRGLFGGKAAPRTDSVVASRV